MSTIGNRLRAERERLKLNQKSFGELGGVQKQAQLKYEKGDRSPDACYLSAIATAGVDLLYVLTGTRSKLSPLNSREVALLDNYRHSSVEVQSAISKLLAETGNAVERAYKIDNTADLINYEKLEKGLSLGTHLDAVHSDDKTS